MDHDAPAPALNPAQSAVLAVLGARPHERPAFDPRLRDELRQQLEDALTPVANRIPPGETLWLSKYLLGLVHGCEGLFLAQDGTPFAWSPATVRGTISHKAIELSLAWRGDPSAGELVEAALATLIASTDSLSDYLAALPEGERAEVRGEATERVNLFLECFPPLEPRWRPVAESRLRADLNGDRIVLAGKVDLSVGRAHGTQAGKVLIDLKTGSFAPHHHEDLRFYALIETLRLGVPPRLVASYYLDGARLQEEVVTLDTLSCTVERVVAAAGLIVALRHDDRTPVLKPGPPCRWCPQRSTCDVGQQHLREQDDPSGW